MRVAANVPAEQVMVPVKITVPDTSHIWPTVDPGAAARLTLATVFASEPPVEKEMGWTPSFCPVPEGASVSYISMRDGVPDAPKP